MKNYRYCCNTACDIGEHRHPETVIRELAPDATNLQPESLFDCWMFDAAPIFDPPKFIKELGAFPPCAACGKSVHPGASAPGGVCGKCAALPVVGIGEHPVIPDAPAPVWPAPPPPGPITRVE